MAAPLLSYGSKEDLVRFGVAAAALRSVSPADQEAALEAASRTIDGFLKGAKYVLPLTAVGIEIRQATAIIAAFSLLNVRGYPNEAAQELIERNYDRTMSWLGKFMSGTVIPDVTDSSSKLEDVSPGGKPEVVSSDQRGWFRTSDDPNDGGAFTGGRR